MSAEDFLETGDEVAGSAGHNGDGITRKGEYSPLALIRRLRQPAHPFGARRFASVQKPYKPSGFFLLAFGNTVARWGGVYKALARLSA